MNARQRLKTYTNLNRLKDLDYQDRKELAMDLRELLWAAKWWMIAALITGGILMATLGAFVSYVWSHAR